MKNDFEEKYIELARDGRIRTVHQIREALGLPVTSNVGANLGALQLRLAGSDQGIRLRRSTLRARQHQQVWWLEIKEKTV
jgi:hypothetical protein